MVEITQKDIAIESSLLKLLSERKHYDVFASTLDYKKLLPDTVILLSDYDKYFKAFNHDAIDWGVFFTEFAQNWHRRDFDDNDIAYYKDSVFPTIRNVGELEVNRAIVSLIERSTAEKLLRIVSGAFSQEEAQKVLDEHTQRTSGLVASDDDDCFSLDKVDFSILDKANGIPWFLPTLQKGLGSLVQGQFVVVSADYGTGKSAFVISQAVAAFKHAQKHKDVGPILYFNSEGTTADVFCRFLSCLYNAKIYGGFEEVLTRIDEVRNKFSSAFNIKNLLVFQVGCGDMFKIQQKIDMYKPSVVIIDIADVLAPEEDPKSLKKLFDGIRLLSAKYCPIIATTQSGDTSYKDNSTGDIKHRKWLGDKALYGSKAGKGGAASEIITIGKDDDIKNIRYISTPKKKRGTMVQMTCELIDEYSLYREI
jgi:hypothetical protein